MEDREVTLRSKRTASASAASGLPASPKTLTSFPSFTPPPSAGPKKKSSAKSSRLASGPQTIPNDSPTRNRASTVSGVLSDATDGQSSSTSTSDSTGVGVRKSGSSIWKGATTLHKSLLASLTGVTATPKTPVEGVFNDLDWQSSDPLENATDEQIQKVIDRNGGAIPSLRQFSKDLSESNGRVAEERNRKLEIIDRNRLLREENDQLKLQLEEMQRKYKSSQNLFKRFVRPEYPGQIQIVDSPNGHYILDSTTGEMIDPLKPLPKSVAASIKTQASVGSSTPPEQPLTVPQKLDAVGSLKQIAPRKPPLREERKHHGSISLPQRPDSLELRSPVTLENLPPALRGVHAQSDGAPVDRLGFFFTASRETRHQEALAFHPKGEASETSSVNSFPFSDDGNDASLNTVESQDDSSSLNAGGSGSSTAELLSYAPVGPALRFVSTPEHGIRMFVDVSTPTTPTTPTESLTTTNADGYTQSSAALAQPSIAGTLIAPVQSSPGANALDALLEKLNETHDKQQERRVNEWSTFHNYLKANIPKGLSRTSSDYGMASISRLCSKGAVSPETLKKFNNLILSGIPVTLRREVWMERTGASTLVEPGRFKALLAESNLDSYTKREITIDVERTMGNNVFFRNGVGKEKLQDVLVAYAHFNPTIGYSQGLNIIAGNLLLMLPSSEDVFWLLVAIIDNILPQEYYNQNGSISGAIIDIDGKVLNAYCNDLLGSALHKHLLIHSVDLTMFTPGWFISAFAACLSGEPLYRIWDVLFGFCDGRYIFCFALALLKINRRGLLACGSSEELMLYLGGRMTATAVSLDVLIKEAVKMGTYVTTQDLEKRREMFA